MDFVINGTTVNLTKEGVERSLRGLGPDSIQQHSVVVGGVEYPVKQALSTATGLSRAEFTSQTAQRLLSRLGFDLLAHGQAVGEESDPRSLVAETPREPGAWPWEGAVQDVFADYLRGLGWTITGMADTATKARGVDLLASKGDRRLGAEVKGWPSKGYADPRRSEEKKRTQPSTQAGHWFSQALMKATMLLDSHPDFESLVVLPDYPRYRDLANRTLTGRTASRVHVVFVHEDGKAVSDSWTP